MVPPSLALEDEIERLGVVMCSTSTLGWTSVETQANIRRNWSIPAAHDRHKHPLGKTIADTVDDAADDWLQRQRLISCPQFVHFPHSAGFSRCRFSISTSTSAHGPLNSRLIRREVAGRLEAGVGPRLNARHADRAGAISRKCA